VVTLAGEEKMNEPAFNYSIRSDLPAHPETPAVLGDKFVATLDRLTRIDPVIFADWVVMDLPAVSSIPLKVCPIPDPRNHRKQRQARR
jgi:hypothetical protein